eukprot:1387531-Rhodomonas_salina.1
MTKSLLCRWGSGNEASLSWSQDNGGSCLPAGSILAAVVRENVCGVLCEPKKFCHPKLKEGSRRT